MLQRRWAKQVRAWVTPVETGVSPCPIPAKARNVGHFVASLKLCRRTCGVQRVAANSKSAGLDTEAATAAPAWASANQIRGPARCSEEHPEVAEADEQTAGGAVGDLGHQGDWLPGSCVDRWKNEWVRRARAGAGAVSGAQRKSCR